MSKLYGLALGVVVAAGAIVACASSASEHVGETVGFDTTDASVAAGSLVLSQVYGGGGRTGAAYNHDFAEILNRTTKDITLDGLSLQLATSPTGKFTIAIPLTGTIKAQSYFLVELGTNDDTSSAADVPAPDLPADPTTPQIGSPDAKIAIANVTTALGCGSTGTTCPTSKLIDLVGYGATNTFEGTGSAPAQGDAKKSELRNGDGCTDANDNSKDFTLGDLTLDTVKPRNSGSPTKSCVAPPKTDAGGDGGKPGPINEPDPGPESAYDGGSRPDSGKPSAGGGGGSDSGCSVGSAGTSSGAFAPFGLFAMVALFGLRRRRR